MELSWIYYGTTMELSGNYYGIQAVARHWWAGRVVAKAGLGEVGRGGWLICGWEW